MQDQITLVDDRLTLYLGTKLEQNDFTGLEYEPAARLLWLLDERRSAWGAISRAVRNPAIGVPSYITMDLRLAWRPKKEWELAVVGQNLLQDHHFEFAGTSRGMQSEVTAVPRGVYGTITWRH